MSAEVISLPRAAPHDADAERGVLGAVMFWASDASARPVQDIVRRLDPASFYRPAHACIAASMCELRDKNEAIDVETVWAELGSMRKQQTVGGMAYLGELTDRSGVPAAALRLERRVRELAYQRAIIAGYRTALAILENASGDMAEAADAAMAAVLAISKPGAHKGPRHISESVQAVFDDLGRAARGEHTKGYETGIAALDAVLDPLEAGELVVIGARPSTGKTALVMAIALHIAKAVVRLAAARNERGSVLFFSLETTDVKLARRALASVSSVGLSIVSGRQPMSPVAVRLLQEGAARLHKLPFWIDDRFGLPVTEMRATCRAHQRDHGLSLIVVDYLQLLKGQARREGKRVDEVADVSRELKAIAKEFGVPVIALAQLNRGLESRADKKPTLADLRESGQIEQDADKVVLLHRENKQSRELLALIAKQRDGAADTEAILEFDGPTTGFSIDYDDRAQEPAGLNAPANSQEDDDAPPF